jgi:hypothetical protein
VMKVKSAKDLEAPLPKRESSPLKKVYLND